MAHLAFDNVTVQYPVYDSHGMSLRSHIARVATGGLIERDAGKRTLVTALSNVSLDLRDGDSVGVIGHNGAGKSTLLRTMAGIYPPTRGHVLRQGRTTAMLEIGAGLDLELTGYENILNLGMMMGMSLAQARALTPDIEEFTELGAFLDMPVRIYSAGMTMRLMFAVATSVSPEILLLDEIFSAGDEAFRQKSQDRIKKLISESKIFVFSSHDKELIKGLCNRIFRLEHGTLTEIPLLEV